MTLAAAMPMQVQLLAYLWRDLILKIASELSEEFFARDHRSREFDFWK
jgi:hypothetical protein